jgi:Na+-transporting NADH:ubiquinone oxidoreductase subunit NqrC
MKIKITEQQAKRLRIIKEDIDILSQFEQLCKVNSQEMDKLYIKLSDLSVAEILNNEVSLEEMESYVRNIEAKLMDANRKAYSYIENLPEEDLDLRIDNAFDKANGKISSIQLIIYGLKDLQNSAEEHNLTKDFANLKPIDITAS